MTENSLKKYIDKFFFFFLLYDDYKNGHYYKDLLKAGIDAFLEYENSYTAYEIYRTFFMIYQITSGDKSEESKSPISISREPNSLLDLVQIMKKYEENTGDLIERQRDHFIHSVNVFLLGLSIYAKNSRYREYFKGYILKSKYEKYYKLADGELSHEEFLYRWGIASLFHDIGYPVEIIGKQLNKFINDGVKSISHTYGADTAIDFKDFDEFNAIVKLDHDFADEFTKDYPEAKFLNLFKPTDIMAHKISKDFENVDVNDVARHLDNFVYEMGDLGFIDHGFFSCILVLNSYGYLIQKYSKSHEFFFYPIVDSATSILLHNYYGKVLQGDRFKLKGLHPSQSPIAFLLILCDELQEWNRQPFGVKDKQKGHVNELDIKIDDDSLEVHYIAKSGSLGLGFSEDKEKLLNNVLSLKSVFQFGLRVKTEVQQHFTLNERNDNLSMAPDILLRNVENLAILIHDNYNETIEKEYKEALKKKGKVKKDLQKKYDERCSYDELTPNLKIANIRQARSIPVKLAMIGCELADLSDERPAITEFSKEEVEDLAEYEHEEWNNEKEATGWTYGKKKNMKKKITPYLVPWDDLTENIKEFDRDPIRNIPSLMKSLGLKVVKSKIRLLTIEMHNLHEDTSFDDLPDYIKYTNYKQAEYLIKILALRGYSIVDADSEGNAVTAFDPDTVEYFAEREHESWYKLKINLGWSYGSVKDEISKSNPNLVEWQALDFDKKEANRMTFRSLPELCKKVDLKIVNS